MRHLHALRVVWPCGVDLDIVNRCIDSLLPATVNCVAIALQEPMLYESTFVGLQGLSALHPQGSPELAAAEDALFSLIGSLAEQMKQAYDNEVLYQVRAAVLPASGLSCCL